MTVKDKIKNLFAGQKELSIKEITDTLLVSKQAVHYAMNQLLDENFVEKFGRTPKTIYRLKKEEQTTGVALPVLSDKVTRFIEKNFWQITEAGELLKGTEAFAYWCRQRELPVEKTIKEFISTKAKYEKYYNGGIINGIEKLLNTKGFEKIWLRKIYYLDFYAIERFGKTPLGLLIHFAKQGQNKMLMKMIVDEIKNKIHRFIREKHIDAVGFVPPTIRREVQIMKFFETHLQIDLPKISIQKISGIIPVPQKSLHKIEERIRNAENTFAIKETVKYKHILLIDDAVGSGSTLNQIAGKIIYKKIAITVTGLAIVGSFKGFDVITDV